MSSCCFPSGSVLTRTEREAVARLREQRAQGHMPRAATHTAPTERADPLVTFYKRNVPRPVPRPKPQPQMKRKPTAHQLKKEVARRHPQPNPRHPFVPPSSSTQSPVKTPLRKVNFPKPLRSHSPRDRADRHQKNTSPWENVPSNSEHSVQPQPSTLVERVKGLQIWQALQNRSNGDDSVSVDDDAEDKENPSKSQRLRQEARRKWDDVVVRFGGNTAKGERFVLKERPEPSDFESNDRYFQELMRSET